MKLIGSLTSPYVRKVRAVLAEKKIDCELVLESPWEDGNPVSAYSPLGKVPVLMIDDGSNVFDSRVIVEYLDGLTPNNRLIPAGGRERIAVRRWEALADGICDAATTALLESRRPDGERSPSWIDRQEQKIALGLADAARELGDQAWCHGNGLSLADIALGCALGYLDFRFPANGWAVRHANLAGLRDRLMQRASFSETVPVG